jgi:hypothetical protein
MLKRISGPRTEKDREITYQVLAEKPEAGDHFGGLAVHGRILKLTLEKQGAKVWLKTDSSAKLL